VDFSDFFLQALQFTKNIQDMGQKLVDRIRLQSRHFIALHLRYDEGEFK
jgi:hypothetical protein